MGTTRKKRNGRYRSGSYGIRVPKDEKALWRVTESSTVAREKNRELMRAEKKALEDKVATMKSWDIELQADAEVWLRKIKNAKTREQFEKLALAFDKKFEAAREVRKKMGRPGGKKKVSAYGRKLRGSHSKIRKTYRKAKDQDIKEYAKGGGVRKAARYS